MKKLACITPLLCSVLFGGAAASAVDLDYLNGAPAKPIVASAMPSYTQEVAAEAIPEEAAVEEPEKWLSGNVVGYWMDGYKGTDAALAQAWLTAHKSIDSNRPFSMGYQIDALFGTMNGQCFGDGGFDGKWGVTGDGYAASIFQAYAEVGMGKLSAKVGKFGTLLGFEPLDASADNFLTHTNMYDHEPLTHSGGLLTWAPEDALELSVGLVSGSDNSFGNNFGDTGFLFGATLNLDENLSVSYASELMQVHSAFGADRAAQSFGYYDLGGASIGDQNEYLQSVTVNLGLSDKLSYSFTTNYGTMEDRATRTQRYSQFGLANYLTYKHTDNFSSNLRYEYYTQQLEGEENFDGIEKESKGNYHDITYSINYMPVENMFILPEIRYDWVDELGAKDDGVTGAVGFGVLF